jgi:hypothetical protein
MDVPNRVKGRAFARVARWNAVGRSPPETASRRAGRPSSSRQDRPPSRIDTRGSARIGPRFDASPTHATDPGTQSGPEIRRFCGVGATGFEPATFRPQAKCVSRLRHVLSRFALAEAAGWLSERPIAQSLDGPSMRPRCDLERRQRCRTSHRVAIHSTAFQRRIACLQAISYVRLVSPSAPGRTRTCDPRLRRPPLFPAELPGRVLVKA